MRVSRVWIFQPGDLSSNLPIFPSITQRHNSVRKTSLRLLNDAPTPNYCICHCTYCSNDTFSSNLCYCISTRPLDDNPGEGNLRDGRPGLQQQQQQLLVQPDLFTELYFENFRLQTSVGAGIQSAAEGFSALTRARRGNPWPGVNIVGRDEKNWAGERRDGQNDEGASGGSGGSGGGNGYAASDSLAASLDLHESFDALARARRGTGDDSRSGADGGGGEEDNGNVVSGALEAFFEQYEGFAQEFASRSAFNFADASSKVSQRLVETQNGGVVGAKERSVYKTLVGRRGVGNS